MSIILFKLSKIPNIAFYEKDIKIIEIGAIINVEIQAPIKGSIELSSAAFFENKPI